MKRTNGLVLLLGAMLVILFGIWFSVNRAAKKIPAGHGPATPRSPTTERDADPNTPAISPKSEATQAANNNAGRPGQLNGRVMRLNKDLRSSELRYAVMISGNGKADARAEFTTPEFSFPSVAPGTKSILIVPIKPALAWQVVRATVTADSVAFVEVFLEEGWTLKGQVSVREGRLPKYVLVYVFEDGATEDVGKSELSASISGEVTSMIRAQTSECVEVVTGRPRYVHILERRVQTMTAADSEGRFEVSGLRNPTVRVAIVDDEDGDRRVLFEGHASYSSPELSIQLPKGRTSIIPDRSEKGDPPVQPAPDDNR